jgi:hypothetical protein
MQRIGIVVAAFIICFVFIAGINVSGSNSVSVFSADYSWQRVPAVPDSYIYRINENSDEIVPLSAIDKVVVISILISAFKFHLSKIGYYLALYIVTVPHKILHLLYQITDMPPPLSLT